MSKYPITQAQYQTITGVNPSLFPGNNRPVERVSWNDAVRFCAIASQKLGTRVKLPSKLNGSMLVVLELRPLLALEIL